MFKLVVLLSVAALAAAKPSPYVPVTYTAVPAVSSVSQYSSNVVHGSPVVPAVYSAAYSPYVTGVVPVATLSQAPNSPAVVLDAVNGVPLDTPEVVASRIAHYQAKALSGVHHLAKRSVVPVTYSSVVGPVTSAAPGFHSVVSPVAYSSPFVTAYTAPYTATYAYSAVAPKALSVHPW
ncbi:cuticle protein 18.7-like [Nymphalis io]|uniref:cuticle protein 18.7-like n=1 Tax=Inachis io TaxID=171585 RepID=UPI0021699D22|nr:cuticle protein 18.7-like [Nymphalis io]